MDTIIKYYLPIFAIVTASLNIFLTYRLNILSKYRDRDLNKEYELNTVLSNLLDVWYYVHRYQRIHNSIPSFERQLGELFPVELASVAAYEIIRKIPIECFDELDKSIQNLKKYDPILYFKHIDTGERAKIMRSFTTFMSYARQDGLFETRDMLIENVIEDVKESIYIIARIIGRKTFNQVEQTLRNIAADEDISLQLESSIKSIIDPLRLFFSQIPVDDRKAFFSSEDFKQVIDNLFSKPEELGEIFNDGFTELGDFLRQHSSEGNS